MDLGLDGRVVLVTGGGGGAGPTIGAAFAREGAAVALHQRRAGTADRPSRAERAAADIRARGGRAIAVEAELRSSAEIEAMVGRIRDELGPVTVLVAATSAYRTDALVELDDETWAGVVDDILGATFRVCRAVAPGMAEAGFGRMVLIAARSAFTGIARASHYAAAKAGVVGLAASLAKELGPQGILVNAVAPTQILTVKDGEPSIPDERRASLERSIPVRRVATPEDLANLVVWLGSAANTYVNGEAIALSGGVQS